MILLSVQDLEKSFAHRMLFKGIKFGIESGDRIGLIGPNGAGKSTLLTILAGQATADSGQVVIQKGLRIGFLEQVPKFRPGATVWAAVFEGAPDPDDWEVQARAHEVMSRLSLDPELKVEELSGGWKKRVALARELTKDPDLLLLDEPTNHLDIESILWLEEFIVNSRFATLTVTHDVAFLQKVSNRILDLDRRNPMGLLSIKGEYADYLEAKQQLMSAQEEREIKLKNTLRRETEWLRRGAKARTTKQTARIKAADQLSDEVQALEGRNITAKVSLEFLGADRNPKKLIEAKGISKSYDDKLVVPTIDLIVSPQSRIGLLGPNGGGKSTLVRLLIGEEAPDQGQVNLSEALEVSYFEQNRESLNPSVSVLKTIAPAGDMVEFGGRHINARGYLGRFLFDPIQMEMPVGKLSGGEQSRLLLAKLMLTRANVLVLDEPTNDLDMATLEVLREVLGEFSGAVILVTHDRYFLDQVSNQILAFGYTEDGKKIVTRFANLDQWEASLKEAKRNEKVVGQVASSKGGSKKNKQKIERDLKDVTMRIETLEAELKDLQGQVADPGNARRMAELSKQLASVQSELDLKYKDWESLTTQLE